MDTDGVHCMKVKFMCRAMESVRCKMTHFHTSSTFWPLVPRMVTPSALNSCGLVTGLNVLKVDAPGNRHLGSREGCSLKSASGWVARCVAWQGWRSEEAASLTCCFDWLYDVGCLRQATDYPRFCPMVLNPSGARPPDEGARLCSGCWGSAADAGSPSPGMTSTGSPAASCVSVMSISLHKPHTAVLTRNWLTARHHLHAGVPCRTELILVFMHCWQLVPDAIQLEASALLDMAHRCCAVNTDAAESLVRPGSGAAHRTGCSTVLAARKEAWVVGAASASPAARCIRPPATTSRATCAPQLGLSTVEAGMVTDCSDD